MVYVEKQYKNKNRFFHSISKVLLLTMLCLCMNNIVGQIALQQLDQVRIESYQKKIASDLNKNSFIRKTVVACLFSTIVYAGYKAYAAAPVESAQISKKDAFLVDTEFLKDWKEYLVNAQQKSPELLAKKNFFQRIKGWFKDAFVMMANQAGALCILDIIRGVANPITKYAYKIDQVFEKSLKSIFYKPTLPWFLETRAQFFLFLDEIEKKSEQYSNESNDKLLTNDNNYEEEIAKNWEIIAEQLCSVVAFMNVMMDKKAQYSSLLSIRGKSVVEKIIQIVNTTAHSIEQSLNNSDKKIVASKIKLFKLLLQQEFESFNKIESAQLYQ